VGSVPASGRKKMGDSLPSQEELGVRASWSAEKEKGEKGKRKSSGLEEQTLEEWNNSNASRKERGEISLGKNSREKEGCPQYAGLRKGGKGNSRSLFAISKKDERIVSIRHADLRHRKGEGRGRKNPPLKDQSACVNTAAFGWGACPRRPLKKN